MLVFDVGAHKAQTSLYFNRLFKESTIHAFEPSSQLFEILERNVSLYENIIAHNLALGNMDGKAFLSTSNSDLCGQLSNEFREDSIEIDVCKLDSFCRKKNISHIDLLKIDVEGHEIEVLNGAKDLISKNAVRALYLECDFNSDDTQHSYFPDVLDYLKSRNFAFHGIFDVIRYDCTYGIGYCNALFVNRSFRTPS